MSKRLLRAGAITIGLGALLDVPPHVWTRSSLDGLALAGHVVVLVGMVIVLIGLMVLAGSVPQSTDRRVP